MVFHIPAFWIAIAVLAIYFTIYTMQADAEPFWAKFTLSFIFAVIAIGCAIQACRLYIDNESNFERRQFQKEMKKE